MEGGKNGGRRAGGMEADRKTETETEAKIEPETERQRDRGGGRERERRCDTWGDEAGGGHHGLLFFFLWQRPQVSLANTLPSDRH